MPKVQPIYDTRERACASRESTPIQNERPRGAAGILGEEEQQCATQTDKKSPTPYYLPCRRICQAQSGANEPPHHKRVRTDGAKVLLDLREGARGLSQTGGRFTSSRPCRCEGSSQEPREGSRAQGAPAPIRAAARSRLFPIQETTRPQGFPPWGQEGAPQQKEVQLCRESRVTRASRRRWGRASR